MQNTQKITEAALNNNQHAYLSFSHMIIVARVLILLLSLIRAMRVTWALH